MFQQASPAQKLTNLVHGLCAKYGIEQIDPDQAGIFTFTVNDEISIHCFCDNTNMATLFGTVLGLPKDYVDRDTAILEMMSLVPGYIKTHEEILCLDDEHHKIILYRNFNLLRTMQVDFQFILDMFVQKLIFWRDKASPSHQPKTNSSEMHSIFV